MNQNIVVSLIHDYLTTIKYNQTLSVLASEHSIKIRPPNKSGSASFLRGLGLVEILNEYIELKEQERLKIQFKSDFNNQKVREFLDEIYSSLRKLDDSLAEKENKCIDQNLAKKQKIDQCRTRRLSHGANDKCRRPEKELESIFDMLIKNENSNIPERIAENINLSLAKSRSTDLDELMANVGMDNIIDELIAPTSSGDIFDTNKTSNAFSTEDDVNSFLDHLVYED